MNPQSVFYIIYFVAFAFKSDFNKLVLVWFLLNILFSSGENEQNMRKYES